MLPPIPHPEALTPLLSRESGSRLPRNVVTLGFVSLLMGVSSQMIHSLLPLFLVTVLGASMVSVGLIEGIAEATNSAAKVLSGATSDWFGRRKPLVMLGYGLAAASKPLFPLAPDVVTVLVARFIDRMGKGIRDAPRDALLADQLPPKGRGSGFGLRLALFTVGSVVGPVLAGAVMLLSSGNFRLVFWLAVIPAFLSVAVLIVAVREPPGNGGNGRPRLSLSTQSQFPPLFWWVISLTAVLELGRFSQAFLLLKAHEVGVATPFIPGFLVLMSAVYGISAYPCGILADRLNRRVQWGLGITVLGICHVVLASSDTVLMTAIGAVFWGLQMGILQGLLAVSVADAAPERLRGTAFGIYYFVDGVASLLASSAAGFLWAISGSRLTFSVGALLACVVGAMLLIKPLPR